MSIKSISIHLPTSLVADFDNLRQKTIKIGQVGRTLSIFRTEKVYLYHDDEERVEDHEKEIQTIETLLKYMETPQYLRKDLFPFMDELKYAGLLPPLRTPHHPLKSEKRDIGDLREASVLESWSDRSLLNIGLSEKGVYEGSLEEGTRVTVRLGERIDDESRFVDLASREDADRYWGYEIEKSSDLTRSLSKTEADYAVGTSIRGQDLYDAIEGIKANKGDSVNSVTLAFGGPYQGLFEICGEQDVDTDDLFDMMVNSIPQQGTETVRTEEALLATLAIINLISGRI